MFRTVPTSYKSFPECLECPFPIAIPHYKVRHFVKSGITGLAQVNGWRGNTSIEKRVELDIYYIENWSFWSDIKIIWLTVFGRDTHKNAY